MGGRAWTSQVSRCKLTEPGRARGPRAGRAATVASLRASLPPPEGVVAAETGAPRASPRDATRTRYRIPIEHDVADVACASRVRAPSRTDHVSPVDVRYTTRAGRRRFSIAGGTGT